MGVSGGWARFLGLIGLLMMTVPAQSLAEASGVGARSYRPYSDKGGRPPVREALRFLSSAGRGVRLQLGAPDLRDLYQALKNRRQGAIQIGVPRTVERLKSVQEVDLGLDWRMENDGSRVGHLSLVSDGAEALRLGLFFERLPEEAEFRFHNGTLDQVRSIRGSDIRAVLDNHRKRGETASDSRVFWSPIIDGETIGLEVVLPPGLPESALRFTVAGLSHLSINPAHAETLSGFTQATGSCHVDAMCYPAWRELANAIARISFVERGASYLCSGTLLNDSQNSDTPYFLTANHCIASQTVASTITSYWFYHASTCNSVSRNPGVVSVSGGGTLLYSSSATDAAFLKLNGPVPEGVTFAGWTIDTPPLGTLSTTIHHPEGDLLKMGFGQTTSYERCDSGNRNSFDCTPSSPGAATFVDLRLSTGTTESGSSGSGVFLDSTQQLYGQLYGGSSSCNNLFGSNMYGLFGKTYQNGQLERWLGQPRESQTVRIEAPPGLAVGATTPIGATASSGLTVDLSNLSPELCRLNGSMLTGLSPGPCRLKAYQSGDARYASAEASAVVTVTLDSKDPPINPTLQVTVPATLTWGDSTPVSVQGNSGSTVLLFSETPKLCAITEGRLVALYPGLCQIRGEQLSHSGVAGGSARAVSEILVPRYPAPTRRLSVKVSGLGEVLSDPAGIACGVYCRLAFPKDSRITLRAKPEPGRVFIGWKGACRGSALTCELTLSQGARSVRAQFR